METPLVHLLSSLPIRSPGLQIQLWSDQQADYSRYCSLKHALGKEVTSQQVKRLNSLGLSYENLVSLRQSSESKDEFIQALRDKRVFSEPLREKLWTLTTN